MSTQKIQNKGFTLVELIVVITILVILGTIAFINLGGQSAAARDAKRTSDVRNLVSQVNIKQTGGVTLMDMVSSGVTNQIPAANLSIGGTGGTVVGTDYQAGSPNYTILGLSPDNFKDPNAKTQDYPFATTTRAGGAYQLTATLENEGTKTALVMGTFNARKSTDVASGSIVTSGTTHTLTLATGLGLFNKNDWIKGSVTAGTGTITSISADLKTITIAGTATAPVGPNFVLLAPETLGLIKNTTTPTVSSGVVNGSGTLAY